MVQVGEAVQKSKIYLEEVFPDAKDQNLQLEGVELSDDGKFWYVTFSYGYHGPFRSYKTVKVSAASGKFFGARNGVSSKGLM